MSERISKRRLLEWADIDTAEVRATYFPFPEPVERFAHSEGVNGCTGILYRGSVSGRLYAGGKYSSEATGAALRRALGYRERAVVENLDRIEVHEGDGEYCVFSFVARDGSRFTVATWDFGRTWEICG